MFSPEFTPEELTAIGQLAVDYADLDFFVTHCGAMLLRCSDAEVAWETIARMDFSRKCEKLKDLLKHYQKRHNVLPEAAFAELLNVIGSCKSAGEKRNQIMHAHIHLEGTDLKPVFRHSRTGDTVDATPKALGTLANKISDLAHECLAAVDVFSYVLERL